MEMRWIRCSEAGREAEGVATNPFTTIDPLHNILRAPAQKCESPTVELPSVNRFFGTFGLGNSERSVKPVAEAEGSPVSAGGRVWHLLFVSTDNLAFSDLV